MYKLTRFITAMIFLLSIVVLPFQTTTLGASQTNGSKVIAISSGSHHLALMEDSTVWAWGSNSEGQLGDGTRTYRENPIKIQSLDNVMAVAAGDVHTLALKKDGTVWAWGSDFWGELGNGSEGYNPSPKKVQGLSHVKAIAAGYHHSLAIKEDGTVWSWGLKDETPIQVGGLQDIIAVSTDGYHSLALKADGTVWTWAWRENVTRDDGTTVQFNVKKVEGLTSAKAIYADYDSRVITTDGSVWIWGDLETVRDSDGKIKRDQNGRIVQIRHTTPRRIDNLSDNIVQTSEGIVKKDGSVWTWGDLTYTSQTNSVQVSGLTGIIDIATINSDESIALKADGTVWEWKSNGRFVEKVNFSQELETPEENDLPSLSDLSFGQTKANIQQKWQIYQPSSVVNKYVEEPSAKSPYKAGALDPTFIENGYKAANFVRYLVGFPDDLVLDESLMHKAQYGAVLMAANSQMTHTPGKPADMDQEFYKLGYSSTTSSNIAVGFPTLSATVWAYMSDSDSNNIGSVGHRRWILNPSLKKIGFGYANGYSTMQVFDDSRQNKEDYEYVAWPNKGLFPYQFFSNNDPWSISLNPLKYEKPFSLKVKVKLTRKSDQKVWSFDESNNHLTYGENYLNVTGQAYGEGSTIIFRPSGLDPYKNGEVFHVEINGVNDINGIPSVIEYDVHFFDINSVDSPSGWATSEIEQALALNLVPNNIQYGYTKEISREDFSRLAINLLVTKTGKSIEQLIEESGKEINVAVFNDTKDPIILVANALGIVDGKGHGIFDPYGLITREQAATMLTRTAKVLGLNNDSSGLAFADNSQISGWAAESVAFVSSIKDQTNNSNIMGGTGNNMFSPQATYTKEQAFMTMKRLYHAK